MKVWDYNESVLNVEEEDINLCTAGPTMSYVWCKQGTGASLDELKGARRKMFQELIYTKSIKRTKENLIVFFQENLLI